MVQPTRAHPARLRDSMAGLRVPTRVPACRCQAPLAPPRPQAARPQARPAARANQAPRRRPAVALARRGAAPIPPVPALALPGPARPPEPLPRLAPRPARLRQAAKRCPSGLARSPGGRLALQPAAPPRLYQRGTRTHRPRSRPAPVEFPPWSPASLRTSTARPAQLQDLSRFRLLRVPIPSADRVGGRSTPLPPVWPEARRQSVRARSRLAFRGRGEAARPAPE